MRTAECIHRQVVSPTDSTGGTNFDSHRSIDVFAHTRHKFVWYSDSNSGEVVREFVLAGCVLHCSQGCVR